MRASMAKVPTARLDSSSAFTPSGTEAKIIEEARLSTRDHLSSFSSGAS